MVSACSRECRGEPASNGLRRIVGRGTVKIPDVAPPVPDCRDPCDVPFLVLAEVGKADSLVTGDRDLSLLDGRIACPIVPVDVFLKTLTPRKGSG